MYDMLIGQVCLINFVIIYQIIIFSHLLFPIHSKLVTLLECCKFIIIKNLIWCLVFLKKLFYQPFQCTLVPSTCMLSQSVTHDVFQIVISVGKCAYIFFARLVFCSVNHIWRPSFYVKKKEHEMSIRSKWGMSENLV